MFEKTTTTLTNPNGRSLMSLKVDFWLEKMDIIIEASR